MMERLIQDLRYGIRMLGQKPGFTIIAVLALALGIAANSAIFSVVNTVLLRPLAYKDPERLALIWTKFEPDLPQNWVSGPEVLDFRERAQSFEEIAVLSWNTVGLTGAGDPEQVTAGAVSANLFPMLGVAPARGRVFTEDEDKPGGERVVLLSHGLWQKRFGGDPNLVNQTVELDGQNTTVIGIMPPDFGILPPDAQSPKSIDLWVPLAVDFKTLGRGSHGFRVIGKTRPGVTVEQARAEMENVGEQMDQEFYQDSGFGATAVPFLGHVVRNIRPALLILLGAVSFVLLIACANVANLLLARAASREKEIAIRTALGAGRLRIIRQLLTESVVLALLSGAVGLVLTVLGLRALVALAPDNVPRLNEVGVDLRVLAFTFGVSLFTGVVFGLFPAFQASRPDMNESLKEGGKGSSKGAHGRRVRNLLVVSEVALALVLLTGAGLMIRSFLRLQKVDPGFKPEGVITMRLQVPQSRYPDNPQIVSFYQGVMEKVKALPGVEYAGAVSNLPLSGSYSSGTVTVDQPSASIDNASFEADRRSITPDYFPALGIELQRGSNFTGAETADSQGVVIVDETFANRFWPGEDPIGRRIKLGGNQSTAPWLTIVGVVGHAKHYNLNSKGREQVYFPHAQRQTRTLFLAVRTSGDPSALVGAIRSQVWALDPSQPLSDVQTMEQRVYSSVAQPRFNTMLLGIFASVALILAAIGVYGVMNYAVTQRTHEIGIRMALGARQKDIFGLVVGQGMLLVAIGVAIGLVGAFIVTRLMASLLFGVTATDPTTFAGVALVLVMVSLLASYIPARKATRVDPMVALRYE
ncbi:MAG TPA: ABC transporter permease [Blastocatellia bacterium]|jgi:putative ABC transport system permease protein|nr:ABC transporter permease [Blastocatellia bacterium]